MVWLMRKAGVAMAALALSCGAAGAEHVVPLFMSASNAQQQGFVRIINHSDSAGTVRIRAVDDTGHEASALTLSLAVGAVAHFNSNDLENGNSNKGLAGSAGAGNGDWALVLDTDLDIEALAFVRTSTGFLTPIHGMALTADMTHYIPTFNPGSNSNQQSSLRLINRQSQAAEVTVHGFDDRNDRSDVVSLNIPAGNAISLTAAELEDGPRTASANGALGDGQGKWRLFVESDRPIHAMSLLEDPNGYLTNLSASRKTAGELSAIVDGLDFEEGGGDGDDDHGDGRGDATTIAVDGRRSGRIDPAGDVDWFRISATESGTLTAYTTGSLDTVGRLRDSAGSQLASNDDDGAGANFRIERDVDAGTYFVTVEAHNDSATGGYTLHTEFESDNGGDGGDGDGGGTGEVNFVAVTYGNQIVTSDDGTRWEVAVEDPQVNLNNAGVAYGGGLWVIVDSGAILVSEDGRNWTRVVSADRLDRESDYYSLRTVAYGNGRWTAAGSNTILTSTDGRSWSAVYGADWMDQDPNLNVVFRAQDVDYGGGLWVAAGASIYESTDGRDWKALWQSGTGGTCSGVQEVAYGAGRWYGVFYNTQVLACTRTSDGRWVPFIRANRHHAWDIAFGGGDFVAVGNSQIATWEGGANRWYWVELGGSSTIDAVAYRNGTWVVGAINGPYYNTGDPKRPADWIRVTEGDFNLDAIAATP